MSPDGTTPIPIPHGVVAYQSEFCGTNFGIEQGTAADGTAGTLICKYWFKPGFSQFFSLAIEATMYVCVCMSVTTDN